METNNSNSPLEGKHRERQPNTSISNKFPKTEKRGGKKIDLVELFVKVAGPILTAIGLLLGVWQFQRQQGSNDEQEFKRRIWEKRLDAYMEIGTLTGKLITTPVSANQFDSLQSRFEQVYWGKMPLFEDDSVEYRMKLVKEELQLLKQHEGFPAVLKTRSLYLMHACQKSLYRSWMNIDNIKPIFQGDSTIYSPDE